LQELLLTTKFVILEIMISICVLMQEWLWVTSTLFCWCAFLLSLIFWSSMIDVRLSASTFFLFCVAVICLHLSNLFMVLLCHLYTWFIQLLLSYVWFYYFPVYFFSLGKNYSSYLEILFACFIVAVFSCNLGKVFYIMCIFFCDCVMVALNSDPFFCFVYIHCYGYLRELNANL
jgi:hypothetical protein